VEIGIIVTEIVGTKGGAAGTTRDAARKRGGVTLVNGGEEEKNTRMV